MAKDITIFTTSTCAFCVQVKKWLSAKELSYTEVNLDQQPERRAEAVALSGGMTVPVTKIDDKVVVGFNLPQLAAAIA